MEVLTIIRDYADLAIGLVFLIAAAWVLPGRMKWYVVTAGLAVIGYELYLRVTNKKALAAADAERKRLQARAEELDKRREGLDQEAAGLDRQLAENRTKLADLSQQAAGLQQRGAAAAQELNRVSEEAKRHSEENQALLQSLSSKRSQLAVLDEAQHAVDEMNAARP